MPTWLLRFDADGVLASPATADALMVRLADRSLSHVIFHSHGWNTDFADALRQYGTFLRALDGVLATYPLAGFNPIFVGITWPSVWLAEEPGPTLAGMNTEAATARIVTDLAAPLAAPARARLYALADSAHLDPPAAQELAALLSTAVGGLNDEIGDPAMDAGPTAEDLIEGARRLAAVEGRAAPATLAGPPALDENGLPIASLSGITGRLDPRDLIRLFSLFQMKDRAGRVGATGVATLLRRMMAAAPEARFNLLGHSFGAKVMLSAIAAAPALPRPVDTLLLLQPAISHLAFAATVPGRAGPGGYRAVLERVAAPVFTTFSAMDMPLHDVFHLALRRDADLGEMRIAAAGAPPSRYAALGGYGPRGSGETLIDPIPGPGEPLLYPPGARMVGLDGSANRITSHGDVGTPYTAWVLRHLLALPAATS